VLGWFIVHLLDADRTIEVKRDALL